MKTFAKKAGILAVVISLFCSVTGSLRVQAATTPSLGAAATYGVLASTYTNTSATTINGDVGFTTGPAVPPAGTHTYYGSGAPYTTAGADQNTALSDLNSQPCTFTSPAAIELSTDTTHGPIGVYTPGVYCSIGAMNVGGALTLSGSGTFIFRATGALTTTAGAIVTLSGASACDVFWTPTAATTLGANTTFVGTVIDPSAITVGANSTWTGRALSFSGTVTTDTDTISVPSCVPAPATLHIVKHVVNDDSGTATAASFNVHVKIAGTDVTGSPAPGAESPGVSYILAAGTYVVSEDGNSSYAQSFSGDCDSSGNVTLTVGGDASCTLTNDDIAVPPAAQGTITVIKRVINDNGRSQVIGDFPLFVDGALVVSGATNSFAVGSYTVTETVDSRYTRSFSGDCNASGQLTLIANDIKVCIVTNDDVGAAVIVPPVPPLIDVVKVPNPLALPNGPGPVVYTYTLRNIGTVAVTNITMVGDSCSPVVRISGDTDSDNQLDVTETWIYRCSTSLSETHTNTIVATGAANGLTATDIASATVVVGAAASIVPPLIHVTKIPNPLTLLAGGGTVIYTIRVTNPGLVPISDIVLVDDTCSPVKFVSGDINDDTLLNTTETWTYTCQTRLTQTTTNTAIVTGVANSLPARDFAIVSVVVATATPVLPNTGLAPERKNTALGVMPVASWIEESIGEHSTIE